MELWIRSQDKTRLVKPNELKLYCSCEEMPDFANYYIEDGKGELGCYKSNKRALEVLDEIQELMGSLCDSDVKIIQFEMPQE